MSVNFCLSRIIELDEATSTQDIAKNLAESYEEDRVLVQAKKQTNGRGRYDRVWAAAEGGLYISLLLRPKKQIKSTAELSVKTGEAVAETLRELFDIKTKIKLPNDILALQAGVYKKIAGVLIEASTAGIENINWLVIGIGVNLNNKLPKHLNAANVKTVTGRAADITAFRDALIKNFARKYIQWQMSAQKQG